MCYVRISLMLLLFHTVGPMGCFSYLGLAIYVIYFVPLWLENHF